MSRGANGKGTRGAGRVARSENPRVRAIMSQKSPSVRLVGNLAKSKSLVDRDGILKEGDDVPPTEELLDMAGKELGGAEKVIANSEVEHGAIYDDDGKQVMIKTSHDTDAVYLSPKEMKAMKDKVFTHNHPTGPNGLPIPFSRGDVTLMHFTKAKEFRAVSGNTVFSISPPKDSKFWKMKEPAVDKMLNAARLIAFQKIGLSESDVQRGMATTQQVATALDDMLSMVDRQLNLGYKKSKL